MSKDYLILFDDEGNRTTTYANGVHYYVDVDGVVHGDSVNVEALLAQGYIWVDAADYANLLGNNNDNQIYILQDGKFVPKPPYVPTAEETQAANLAKLDADYSAQLDELKEQIVVAATVDQDEEYAAELRQQRQDLQAEYVAKRGEV